MESIITTKSFKHAKPNQSNTVPTHSQGFLLPGNRTGPASAAMAWRLWKVEPIRSQSFVPIFGAFGPNERWWMRPPDLLTMKRWSGAILLHVAHLAALLLRSSRVGILLACLAGGWSRVRTGCEPTEPEYSGSGACTFHHWKPAAVAATIRTSTYYGSRYDRSRHAANAAGSY